MKAEASLKNNKTDIREHLSLFNRGIVAADGLDLGLRYYCKLVPSGGLPHECDSDPGVVVHRATNLPITNYGLS